MKTISILMQGYFKAQKHKKRNQPAAILLFVPISLKYLPKTIRYLAVSSFVSGKRTVNTGYGLYGNPLLVSYPRIGTNKTRYIIASLSGGPTPGQRRLHEGVYYVIDRAHTGYPVIGRHGKLVLVIRDYRECLRRTNAGLWKELRDADSFLDEKITMILPHRYIDNSNAVDALGGGKLLMYYEDLVGDPNTEVPRLSDFLGFDQNKTDEFLAQLEQHKQTSISLFTSGGHDSETRGDIGKVSYHADQHASAEDKRMFDSHYRTRYPALFERYLARYSVS